MYTNTQRHTHTRLCKDKKKKNHTGSLDFYSGTGRQEGREAELQSATTNNCLQMLELLLPNGTGVREWKVRSHTYLWSDAAK